MAFSVRHITKFRYEGAVRESVMEVRMQPRSDARQRCLTFSLDVTPGANILVYRDFFGNTVHHFDIPGRHSEITVSAQSIVEVIAGQRVLSVGTSDWEDLDASVAKGDYWELLVPSQFAKPTELLEKLSEELGVTRRGTPGILLTELNAAIYEAFEYVPNSTQVDSPIDDALLKRQGVCQDFAHIMLALVRPLKIPCRYVSGYLFHGEESRDRSPSGASHAWVEAYLPEAGWVLFDPTNNLVGGERHIHVAVGRDYADVPPTRGVHKGGADSELSVLVTVTPVESVQPEYLLPATVTRTRSIGVRSTEAGEQMQQQQQQ
jgi:transglutaminase-like putative cysteine protease